jgi:hypothetical protein
MLLQGTIERQNETGKCSGIEVSVDKTKVMRISRESFLLRIKIHQTHLKSNEYSKNWGCMINDSRYTREIKSKIAMEKQHSTVRRFISPENWI